MSRKIGKKAPLHAAR